VPSGVALPSSGDHDAAVVSVRAGGCVGYGYGLVDRVGVLPSGNREGLRRHPLRGGGGPAGGADAPASNVSDGVIDALAVGWVSRTTVQVMVLP
jgi:hypothetical protein